MARPRTPTKILEMRGSFKNRPSRRRARENEPIPTGVIGDPPKHLQGEKLKGIWREIIAATVPGVLTNSDRILLEIICYLLDELRSNPAEFPSGKMTRLESMLGKCGLAPADRTKIAGLGKEEKENPFASL